MDKVLSNSNAGVGPVVQVCFPNVRASVLDNLNRQREEGRLCDLSIQVQGQVFRAHRCVLAASSPYFHDQVLLKNVTTVSLPSVMDPLAFESVLNSAYTGQLSIVRDDIVNYVTVASFLQMWHIVDKCTDILKRSRPLAQVSPGEASSSRHQSPSSSDCCLTDPEERGQAERGGATVADRRAEHSTLPPLATWKRPQHPHLLQHQHQHQHQQQHLHHQQGRWGRSRLCLPAAHHRADSPAPECVVVAGPSGEGEHQRSPPEGLWIPGGGGGGSGERQRVRARLRGATESREQGMRGEEDEEEEEDEESRRRRRQQQQQRGDRWMEADEGVGEELEEERVKVELEERGAGGGGSGATLKEEGEREAGRESAHRQREQEEQGFPSAQSHAGDSQEASCPASVARAQWQPAGEWPAPLPPPPYDQSRIREVAAEHAEEELDFARFAEAGFEGETYDEIEEATGQVSQRPLLPPSPSVGGGEFVLGPSELTWTSSGGLSPPSHSTSLPPSSSPIPSSSSPAPPPALPPPPPPPALAGTSYAGKVHFCHCGKAFTLKSMRDRHVKMQHLNLRPFSCPVCAKSFKMKHHLTKHVKTHGALRPYECALCAKKIIWRDSYLKHQARCQRLASRAAGAAPGYRISDVGDCANEAEVGQEEEEEGLPPEYAVYMCEGRGLVKVEQGDMEGQLVEAGQGIEGLAGQDGGLMEQVLKEEDGGRYT